MEKFFLNSKTIQGVILLFIAFAKVFFDVEITAVEIEPIITGVVGLVGAILALYGRFNVKDPVTFSLPSNEIYGGAIDGVKETDRIMGETATVQDLPLLKQGTVHKYNQNKVGSNSCTLVTAVTAWTYTTGVVRSYENLQEAYRRACKAPNPLDPKIGRSLHLAVDLIRKLGKEFYGVDTNTMALSIDNDLEAVQKKGYMVSSGFRGNKSYNNDKNDDGIVSNLHKNPTYGHAPTIVPNTIVNDEQTKVIQDNYEGVVKYNKYRIDVFKEYVKSKLWFTRGFVFYKPVSIDNPATSYEKMKNRANQLKQEGKTKSQTEKILLIEKSLGKFR